MSLGTFEDGLNRLLLVDSCCLQAGLFSKNGIWSHLFI